MVYQAMVDQVKSKKLMNLALESIDKLDQTNTGFSSKEERIMG